MPRYFFNTVDGRRYPDEDGTELPDMEAMRRKATLTLGELLREWPSIFWDTGRLRLEVADEDDAVVLAIDVTLREQKAD